MALVGKGGSQMALAKDFGGNLVSADGFGGQALGGGGNSALVGGLGGHALGGGHPGGVGGKELFQEGGSSSSSSDQTAKVEDALQLTMLPKRSFASLPKKHSVTDATDAILAAMTAKKTAGPTLKRPAAAEPPAAAPAAAAAAVAMPKPIFTVEKTRSQAGAKT